MNELALLNTPIYKKDTTVSADPDKQSKILISMNMTFPNMPCPLITISSENTLNKILNEEIRPQLTWSHIDHSGKPVKYFIEKDKLGGPNYDGIPRQPFDTIDEKEEVSQFFWKNLSCNINGQFLIQKVTG